MKLAKNGEAGQILILALILLAMGPLLVIPMLRLSYSGQRYNQIVEIITLNAYAADSGIEYGKYQIYNNPAEIIETPLDVYLVINGIDVHVTVEYDYDMAAYIIISTASRAQRSSTIECTIVIDVGLFGNVVACDGNLLLDQCDFVNEEFEGESDVYTNGDIELKQSIVDGDVSVTGTYKDDGHSEVRGEITTGDDVDVLEFPAIDAQIHEDKAKDGGIHNGDLTLDGGTHDLGPLYINGKLDVKGGADLVLHGTVYVTGDVNIDHTIITGFGDIVCEGSFSMNHYSLIVDVIEYLPLFMCVYKDMNINTDHHESSEGTQAILYAPNDKIVLDHVTLYGSVAAEDVECKQSEIKYPAELRGRADLPGAGLDIVTYTFK